MSGEGARRRPREGVCVRVRVRVCVCARAHTHTHTGIATRSRYASLHFANFGSTGVSSSLIYQANISLTCAGGAPRESVCKRAVACVRACVRVCGHRDKLSSCKPAFCLFWRNQSHLKSNIPGECLAKRHQGARGHMCARGCVPVFVRTLGGVRRRRRRR